MREILFRGKRVDSGEWVYGYYCGPFGDFDEHEICDIADPTCSRVDVDPETVGQYTGLTDNNGKQIFEGDIVEGEYFDDEDGYGIIQWNDGAFEIVNDYTCATFHENLYGTDLSVIGNVHDNPELIGGKEDGT